MNLKGYHLALNDKNVLKIKGSGSCYFLVSVTEKLIEFSFQHNDISGSEMPPSKRIFARCFPLKNLEPNIKYVLLNDVIKIMANSDVQVHALTYTAEFFKDKNQVLFKIEEMPVLSKFVSKNEIEGLLVELM